MHLSINFRLRFYFTAILVVLFVCVTTSCEDAQKSNGTAIDSEETPDSPSPEILAIPKLCDECVVYDFNGIQREYLVHVPDNLPKNAPLVFLLHGSGGKASNFQGWLEMDEIADTEGFVVAYPQGILAGEETHWNAGLRISTVDDVGFLSALAQYLQKEYQLNSNKTFTAGYSNGGFMSYELMAKRPEIFKAAASFNGTMSGQTWMDRDAISPAPVLQISGALDETIPIDGSLPTSGGWGGAPDMQTVLNFWAELNECTTNETARINGNTTVLKYKDGINGNEVWYYLLDNFGHEFPLGEDGNFNTTELVWEFFSKY